jgi:two-component system sensor histidine kinase KdpD
MLENAVHHAKGMTEIVFKVRLDGSKAIFEISDDGCGIDKDRLDNIFNGFYDDNRSTDAKRRNAGIGLSVCDTIIKAHSGKITAANRPEGGAVFSFMLAASESDEEDGI